MSDKHTIPTRHSKEPTRVPFERYFNTAIQTYLPIAGRAVPNLAGHVFAVAPEYFAPALPQTNVQNSVGEVAAMGRIQAQNELMNTLGQRAAQGATAMSMSATGPQVPQAHADWGSRDDENHLTQAAPPQVTAADRQSSTTAAIDSRVTPGYITEQIQAMQQQFGLDPGTPGQPVVVAENVTVGAEMAPEVPIDAITAAQRAVSAALDRGGALQDA